MHRLSNGTQSPTPPANPGVVGEPGYPIAGNAALGIAGSVRDAYWDYVTVEELAYLVERRGIALDKANPHQIAAALDATYTAQGLTSAFGRTSMNYAPSAGHTYVNTLTFTPPVNGTMMLFGIINLSGAIAGTTHPQQQPYGSPHDILVNGVSQIVESTVGSNSLNWAFDAVAGVTLTMNQLYSTIPNVPDEWVTNMSQRFSFLFVAK